MSSQDVGIRLLSAYDVAFAMELKNAAGWNQTEEDWHSYLAYDPEGCFMAEAGGERAGTATAITYQKRFGWVGMVLVHPSKRRLGIGTNLLNEAIRYIQDAGVNCVKLDATPMGRKVYVQMGFKDEYELIRFQGEGQTWAEQGPGFSDRHDNMEIKPITESDLKQIVLFDQTYFGAERGKVLLRLWQRNPEYGFYIKGQSGVAGYIMAHLGHEAMQIGPWVATEDKTAEKLFEALLHRAANRKIFLDVPCPNEKAIKLMDKYEFTVQRGFTRMYLGDNPFPGEPQKIYGTSGAEKG